MNVLFISKVDMGTLRTLVKFGVISLKLKEHSGAVKVMNKTCFLQFSLSKIDRVLHDTSGYICVSMCFAQLKSE